MLVERRRQVTLAEGRNDDDDQLAGIFRTLGQLQRSPGGGAGRDGPDDDAARLTAMGVARVYTPKDFQLNTIMMDIVGLVAPGAAAA